MVFSMTRHLYFISTYCPPPPSIFSRSHAMKGSLTCIDSSRGAVSLLAPCYHHHHHHHHQCCCCWEGTGVLDPAAVHACTQSGRASTQSRECLNLMSPYLTIIMICNNIFFKKAVNLIIIFFFPSLPPFPFSLRRSGTSCQRFWLCMRNRVPSQGSSWICKPSAFRPKRTSPKKKHAIGHEVSAIITFHCVVTPTALPGLLVCVCLTHTHSHAHTHRKQIWFF